MKKRIIALFFMAILPLLLAGCFKQSVTVEMGRNGRGSVACTLAIEDEVYQSLLEVGAEDPFEGMKVSVTEYEDKTWHHSTQTVECDSYEEIEDALLDLRFRIDLIEDPDGSFGIDPTPIFSDVDVKKESTLFTSTYTFRAETYPQSINTDRYELDDGYKLELTVELPGSERSITGGSMMDGVAIFDVESVTECATYEVTTVEMRPGMIGLMLVGSIAVLILLIWMLVLIRKRMK